MTPIVVSIQHEEGYTAFGALRLAGLTAGEAGRAEKETLLRAADRQRDFLRALHAMDGHCFCELRTIVEPAPARPAQGRVRLYIVVLARAAERHQARELARTSLDDLAAILRSANDDCDWTEVDTPEEMAVLQQPFPLSDVAEIVRRETTLRFEGAAWTEKRIPGFGFQRPEPAQDPPTFRHIYPITARNISLSRLYEALLLQPSPLLISCQLRPSSLTDEERGALRQSIAQCEAFLASSPHRAVERDNGSTMLRQGITALAQVKLEHLERLEDCCFAMRLRVAAMAPLSGVIVSTIATHFGGPTGANSTGMAQYFMGGPQCIHLVGDALEVGRSVLRYEKGDDGAEADRQGQLYDLFEAQAAFRYPVSEPGEFPGIDTRFARFLPPPRGIPTAGARLGVGLYRNSVQPVFLREDDRRRHCYVVGQSGTGKSTTFLSMILDDIRNGKGLAVVDAHGDLIDDILGRLPKERHKDVVLFDAGDRDWPIGVNPLEWETEDQKAFLVQEMIAILFKMFPPEMIGPVFEHNVRNGMLTVMSDPSTPGTLVELPRLWSSKDEYKRYLPHIEDPLVRDYWLREMASTSDHHRSEVLSYLVSKFERFIADPIARNIIGQRRSALNLRRIIDSGKILLVDLGKGSVGEINAQLLGMVFVAKLQAAAIGRVDTPVEQRRDFYLYVDEFQNFATEHFATLLSEARKFRLNLVLTNQYLSQLRPQIIDALLGNVGTLIALRVGVNDAPLLERQFAPFVSQSDLVTVPNWHGYVNLLVDGERVRPFTLRTVLDATPTSPENAAAVRQYSRERYAQPRARIEEALKRRLAASRASAPKAEPAV